MQKETRHKLEQAIILGLIYLVFGALLWWAWRRFVNDDHPTVMVCLGFGSFVFFAWWAAVRGNWKWRAVVALCALLLGLFVASEMIPNSRKMTATEFLLSMAGTMGPMFILFYMASTPRKNVMTVDSSPSGADVLVDGAFKANTPAIIKIPKGHYRIRIEAQGHQPWERELDIAEDLKLSPKLERIIVPVETK